MELPQLYDQSPNASFIFLGKPIDYSVAIFIKIQPFNITLLTSGRLIKDSLLHSNVHNAAYMPTHITLLEDFKVMFTMRAITS